MTIKTEIKGQVIKPWAVFYLDGDKHVCIEKFGLRGDAEVYASKLRRMISHKVEVTWSQD